MALSGSTAMDRQPTKNCSWVYTPLILGKQVRNGSFAYRATFGFSKRKRNRQAEASTDLEAFTLARGSPVRDDWRLLRILRKLHENVTKRSLRIATVCPRLQLRNRDRWLWIRVSQVRRHIITPYAADLASLVGGQST